jgi:hypothetical protein
MSAFPRLATTSSLVSSKQDDRQGFRPTDALAKIVEMDPTASYWVVAGLKLFPAQWRTAYKFGAPMISKNDNRRIARRLVAA